MWQMHFKWFGQVERMGNENWVRKCKSLEINGVAGTERPRKTWKQVGQGDALALYLEKGFAQDGNVWRKAIKNPPSYPC